MAEWSWRPDLWSPTAHDPAPAALADLFAAAPGAPGAAAPDAAVPDAAAGGEMLASGLGADVPFPPPGWFPAPPDAAGDELAPLSPHDAAPDAPAAPADELAVDAVSGVEPEPVADPSLDPLTVQPQDEYPDPVAMRAEQLSQMSPEEFAAESARQQGEREAHLAAEREERLAADKAQAEANAARASAAREKAALEYQDIQAEAERIANTEPDRKRWFKNASTAEKLGAALATIAGGFLAPYQGGKNSGLDFVMGVIDGDIQDQRDALDRRERANNARRGMVGQLYAMGMDEYAAAETVRLAALSRLDQELAVEQAKYDPEGTAAMNIASARREARAQQAAHAAQVEKELFERNMKISEFNLERAKAFEARRSNKEQERIAGERVRLEGDRLKAEYEHAAKADADRAAQLRMEHGVGQPGELQQKDGTPFLAADAGALRKQHAAVNTLASIMDRALELRESAGWSSDIVKSPEWQEMKALWGAAIIEAKNVGELGALSESDMELVGSWLGAQDPTEFRDPSAGIRAARRTMVERYNNHLRASGYTGKPYVPAADHFKGAAGAARFRSFDDTLKVIGDPNAPPAEVATALRVAREMAGDDSERWDRLVGASELGRGRRKELYGESY